MDECIPSEALARGFISIGEAIKQGLSKKDRTTLYREAVSGAIPSCLVKKGTRSVLWVQVASLGSAPVLPQNERSYTRLEDLWISRMRNGTFGANKPYSEETIAIRKWAMAKYWQLLEQPKSLANLSAANFEVVLGKFDHDIENRNDHFASKMQIYKAISGFFKFLIREDLKPKSEREKLLESRPKPRYKPKKKLVEDYEIAEAIKTNLAWRSGRSSYDVIVMDLLLHLYGYAGLRREEALTLRREDVFFKDRLIKVFGKGSKERFVTPHPQIWPTLQEWFQEYCTDSPVGLLLTNIKGQPFTKRSISQRFENFSEKAGKPIHPHALRRGFAVLMANLGMPLNQLQLILGHEDIQTTMGYVMTNYKHAQKWVDENLTKTPEIVNELDSDDEDIWDDIINS